MANKSDKKAVKTEAKAKPSHSGKQSIHPNYREIQVLFTNGNEVVMRSAIERKSDAGPLRLEIDCHTHPAWTNTAVTVKTDSVEGFKKKYGNMSFFSAGQNNNNNAN